jgi:hypothetical protein
VTARWVVHGALALAFAGCGVNAALSDNPAGGDDGGSGTRPPTPPCAAAIDVAQPVPAATAGATLHATARPAGLSAPLYMWQVQFDGAPIDFQRSADGAAIDVAVERAGIYLLGLAIQNCTPAFVPVNVETLGARIQTLRLQVVPPLDVAVPPLELFRDVKGGADVDLGAISAVSGRVIQTVVLGPAGGVPAYLQFSPSGAPDAIIEAFSDASGIAGVQLPPGPGPYTALVVPSAPGLAPRRVLNWSPGAVLQVDAGSAISGTVVRPGVPGPADVPLAGATVRLVSDGVPSTLAVTAADGSFALQVVPGGTVTVEVTPPDDSGLPRLSATSTGFNLGAPVQVRYAANLGRVDLAGTVVQRKGTAVAGARLAVVGALATAGMVTAGAMAVATGQVRIAATADAAGALPRTLVPSAALSAVIEVGPGDLAVTPLDTTGGAPARLEAPAMQLITTAVTAMTDGNAAGLPGALIDLVPTGALAMAAAPMVRLVAGDAGTVATALPSGGRYQLRFQDPQGRGAPLVVADRAITAIASSYLLPAAIRIQGTLLRDGQLALPGASVQLMCTGCTGLDAALPLAGAASDATGRFTLAVPDPGTR